MADETEETTPASDPSVEQRVDSLESKVDRILGIVSGQSPGQETAGQDGGQQPPANVADEIRQQLDERDRKAASAAEDAAKTDRLAALETKVSELAEKPPGPMPRKVEKWMWG